MIRRVGAALALSLAALTASTTASAGSFQVNPVRLDLRNGATSGSIVIRNDGAEPVVVQVSVLAWSQTDGKDVYAATPDALTTPPIATIAPGAEQVLRFGLRRGADPTLERAYRMYVQEVPPPPQPGFAGLQVALRVGLPVFVEPIATVVRQLGWSAVRLPDNRVRLTLHNRGNVHLQISDFALRPDPAAAPIAGETMLTYVLAGQTRSWDLAVTGIAPAPSADLHLTAFTDAGEINATVRLEP